ncbi:hypothetical protein BU26DRAFT_501861 [Trematosphaeria pertusa]|uniref:Uncharacterized protein n=1 Tax=Trematosphaeria pertusa TaxID=390896 RepID=A0A6A6IU51_9PLEO|nr:uncharacterized protein BU26DRAFT_501861 [Trematosphaeria pertusa]KAF2253718.1 hypothetical protein BU26DRAFT_501861 [Trematosphaeria pertusa]
MGPTLPSLPTEIVSKISQHLISGPTNSYATDMDALYGLRLTCRALNSKTLYDFSKAAFSSLIVDFFPASLDRLHAISQHPDLGKAVKCLHFAHHAEPTVSLGEEEVDPDAVPLEARVQGILRAGLGQIFTGLPNLSEVVIITPLAAIFRQWRSVTAHPPHVSEMRNEIEEANEREPAATIFTEQWALTANFLHQLVLEAADKANIELQSLEVRAPAIYPTTNLNARFAPAYARLKSLTPASPITPHGRRTYLWPAMPNPRGWSSASTSTNASPV